MGHKIHLTALFSFAAVTLTALCLYGADTGTVNFPYKAGIEGKTTKNKLYRAAIGAEVLEKCGGGCSSARIFDSAGREIPFVILEERTTQGPPENHTLEVLSLDEKNGQSIITLRRNSEKTGNVNRMDVTTTEHDFHKHVAIDGSNDRIKWQQLGQGSIYDFSSQVGLRHTTIALRENGYRFLRFVMKDAMKQPTGQKLRLRYEGLDFSTARPADRKIGISGFAVSLQKENEETTAYDEAAISPVITRDERRKTTEVLIDTILPVETVIFEIDNPYYLRNVTIYGSKTNAKDGMAKLGGTTIHNLSIAEKKEVKNHVDIPRRSDLRYYMIVIEDQANPPLQLVKTTLRWVRKQLFFIALDDGRHYWLYAGDPSVPPASYDIAAVVRADNRENHDAQILTIGPVISNSDYKPSADSVKKEQTERFVLMSVVMLLVLVAAFFLYRLWKKAAGRGGQNDVPRGT